MTGGWVEFEGRVEPIDRGRATYAILRLPPWVAEALGDARRVEGEVNEHPVNLAPARAPAVEGPFLWAGRSLLDRLGVEPGEALEVRLRPAPPGEVEVPDDVAAAIRAAGAAAAWAALTPGRRRGLLHRVGTARTAPTRAKRVAALVAEARGG